MGVDFHWISTTISRGGSHNGFGTIVSFPSVPASFPDAGTILQTLTGVPIPVAQGGSSVTIGVTLYLTQTCSVYRKANGSGGDYLDWADKFDVYYLGVDTYLASENGSYQIDINGTMYPNGGYENQYYNDGSGGVYLASTITNYPSNGTSITSTSGIVIYVNVLGTNYASGSYDEAFYSDGSGGYYSTFSNYSYTSYGTFIVSQNNQNEVPSGSGILANNGTTTDFYHDGSGGSYSSSGGSYYSSGTFITNYSGTDYYWDGNGGYYS